ncbi:MAG: protein kinase [Gemmataceae bacterium]|nr:protein kinase [Gemmataceae bacterium]
MQEGPIDELLLLWEEARRNGRQPSVEELCAYSPEHAEELRRRIVAIVSMEQVLGLDAQDATHLQQGAREAAGLKVDEPGQMPTPLLPTIAGYQILEVIDQGGMGIVYKARQVGLGRIVAVKMMTRLSSKMIDRFRAEAEAAARLHHPNIVQVFEVGQAGGLPFFSMEYVAGGSLAQYLKDHRPHLRQAAEFVEALARAVHAAHERGIVHRDLKPGNILLAGVRGQESGDSEDTPVFLTPDPCLLTPKIADFGLAKRLDDDAGHTQTGEVLGTPSYMAPEQAGGKRELIGPRTDVYALGAILYEMLTGQPPFKGSSIIESLRMVATQDPVPTSRLADVPKDLDAICMTCLEKSPARRYASAQALADDLRSFLDGRPVEARPIGPLRRLGKWCRRHPQWTAVLAAAFLLGLLPIYLAVESYRARQAVRQRAVQVAPQVREILRRNCFECHGQDPDNMEKDLNILDHGLLLENKRRIVVPEAPDDSRLIQRIADGSMPPEEEETRLPRLTEMELTILRDWIEGGAPPLPPEDPKQPTPPVVPYSALADQVKSIFETHCYECHKFDAGKGGIKILHHRLLVTVRKVVVPGRPDESELFHLITSKDEKTRMPPAEYERLTAQEIDTIRRWILEGAPGFPKR